MTDHSDQTMRFIKDYKDDPILRKSFNELAKATFGIDFEPWYEKGYWTDAYIPYSFRIGEEIIANVSVNKMYLQWEGQTYSAIQIGTVMTAKAHRKQGLAYKLLYGVMEEWENQVDLIYLFGNDLALDLYLQFDMTPYGEYTYGIGREDLARYKENLKLPLSQGRKLNLSSKEDHELMVDLIAHRLPQSQGIGVSGDLHLIMFYCHHMLADHLWYLPELEAIVVKKEDEGHLVIQEVIARTPITIDAVLPHLLSAQTQRVSLGYQPLRDTDGQGQLTISQERLEVEDQTLLIRPRGPMPDKPFRFPALSHA